MADEEAEMESFFELETSDGAITLVDKSVAIEFGVLKRLLEVVDDTDCVIPLPMVDVDILGKVISYCQLQVKYKNSAFLLKSHVSEFMSGFDYGTVCKLMMAATYLDIKSLRDLTNRTIFNKRLVGVGSITTEELGRAFKLHEEWFEAPHL